MNIVGETEAREWLARRNLIGAGGEFLIESPTGPLRYRIPEDSGKKTALSRLLSSVFEVDGESLLVIREHGIFPSCEDLVLFDGFRRSLGESGHVHEKPGHIFTREDLPVVSSLVAMVLYFVWGAFLVPGTGRFVVEISHDEIMDVYGDGEVLATFSERLGSLLGPGSPGSRSPEPSGAQNR